MPPSLEFQLATADDPDHALLWGLLAPAAVLGIGVFLILGWLKPKRGAAR